MGVKRKASALEEIFSQQPSSPPSLVSASTQSSPSSLCTEPYHRPLSDTQCTGRNDSAPWLNLRTRKRTRDNRPSEQQVYSQTIAKLFDGQKHIDEEPQLPLSPGTEETVMNMDVDTLDNDEAFQAAPTPEPNQRSLHDFFGGNMSIVPKERSMYGYDSFAHPSSDSRQDPVHAEKKKSTPQLAERTTPCILDVPAEAHNHGLCMCRS